jgi:N-acetylglucosaminyldiphosphoundecaprenol N-acetyl-beta-D-mannosaminyltransferase
VAAERALPRTAVDGLNRRSRLRLTALRASGTVLTFALAAFRRVLDLMVAAVLSAATAPIAVAAMAVSSARGRQLLIHHVYLGRWMQPIEVGELDGAPRALRHIPRLWAVLRGDMSLVGPGLMPVDGAAGLTTADLERFQLRPGLADLFTIRDAANIAFEGRTAADAEQIHTSTLLRDLGLLARALPAAVMRGRKAVTSDALSILGVRMDNWTMDQAVSWIVDTPLGSPPQMLAFVNPDCLNTAWCDAGYREILAESSVVLPDGIGIHYACKLLGTSLAANVNGTDLFPRLCDALESCGQSLFLLGGRPGISDALVERMAERWPQVRVAGHHHGYFDRGGEDERAIVEMINASGADHLLVAFGAPHQERWIAEHRDHLRVRTAVGVGGLFDFYSGKLPRAPGWMRELGFEWAWRLLQEPGRMWRRYVIGNPLFLWRVWRWKGTRALSADVPHANMNRHSTTRTQGEDNV